MWRTFLVVFVMINLGPFASADEGQPKQKPTPAPKKAEPKYREVVPGHRDAGAVWQHYGVNRLGRFVPRVIVTEFGPVYSRSLQPYPVYPWREGQPVPVMPYAE